jgi:hypothetical protein
MDISILLEIEQKLAEIRWQTGDGTRVFTPQQVAIIINIMEPYIENLVRVPNGLGGLQASGTLEPDSADAPIR